MSGRSRWGPEGPPEEAYSRVTNAKRFRPLHGAMLEIIGRLESDFDVAREDGYGLDEGLEGHFNRALPGVRLTPNDPGAAPIAVVFSSFPGLYVRFGRWYREPFPGCGCDACDESAEGNIKRLTRIIDNVTTGRFREGIRLPLMPLMGSGWRETEFWTPAGRSSISGDRVDRQSARRLSGGRRRLNLDWKPWPSRHDAGLGSAPAC